MQVEEAYWRALQVLIRFIDLTGKFFDAQNTGSFSLDAWNHQEKRKKLCPINEFKTD